MALTTDALPTLPKLDKNQFISSYLQAQRAHAKSYAEQGRSLSSSWHVPPTPPRPAAANVGFATPILTARIPRTTAEHASKKENNGATLLEPNNNPKTSKPPKPLPKKRGPDSDSDEDQAARLLERRERKRIKRAIVQPKEPSEPGTASSNGDPKQKKRTKAKGKKSKVPSGFALMHGFTATNVGKNRLTLKPPSNVGVFKKGKASFNAKIKPKPKGHKIKHFSEFGFLNNAKKAPEKQTSEISSASDSDSTVKSVQKNPEPKKKVIAQKSRQVKSPTLAQQASELSTSEKRPTAESEIWDIESRASEKRKLLGEKPGSVDEASAIYNQGTVVVDARIPAWSNRMANLTGVDLVEPISAPDAIFIPSSPSLRPSQSASQIGQLLIKPNPAKTASRYFPAKHQRQPTPPPEPESNAIKPDSSPSRDPEPENNYRNIETPNVPPVPGVSNGFVPPTRFVVPTRNRVFAEQFVSVQAVRSQSQDSYPSPAVPQAAFEDPQDLAHYTADPPGALPGTLESGYGSDDEPTYWYSVAEEPLHGDTQLGNYACPQSGGWDANTANPVFDGSWADVYDDGGFDGFSVQYGDEFGHSERMDEDGDGYLAPGYAESDSGAYGHCDTRFVDAADDFGGSASNAGFDTWEEATANSIYLDCFSTGCDSVILDDGDNFMEDADDGQGFLGFTTHTSAVGVDSGDLISNCSDPVGAYTPHFSQGRALLLGLPLHESENRALSTPPHFSSAEVDVVKSLRGHWLPQRL